MNDFNCIIESDPDENSINFIKDELNKYNQMFAEPDNHKLLAVYWVKHIGDGFILIGFG